MRHCGMGNGRAENYGEICRKCEISCSFECFVIRLSRDQI